jgi:hypothetical protein
LKDEIEIIRINSNPYFSTDWFFLSHQQ